MEAQLALGLGVTKEERMRDWTLREGSGFRVQGSGCIDPLGPKRSSGESLICPSFQVYIWGPPRLASLPSVGLKDELTQAVCQAHDFLNAHPRHFKLPLGAKALSLCHVVVDCQVWVRLAGVMTVVTQMVLMAHIGEALSLLECLGADAEPSLNLEPAYKIFCFVARHQAKWWDYEHALSPQLKILNSILKDWLGRLFRSAD